MGGDRLRLGKNVVEPFQTERGCGLFERTELDF